MREKAPVPQAPTASDKSTRAVEDATAEMGTACTRPVRPVPGFLFGLLNWRMYSLGNLPRRLRPSAAWLLRVAGHGGHWSLFRQGRPGGPLSRPAPGCSTRTLHVIIGLLAHMASLPHQGTVFQLGSTSRLASPGHAIGAGPRPRGPLYAAQVGRPQSGRRPGKMGRATVPRLVEGRARAGRGLVCRRPRYLRHGSQTALPKLCLASAVLPEPGPAGLLDPHDDLGQRIFSVERPFSQFLLEVLQSDIVPHLLKEVPNQPTEAELTDSISLIGHAG